MGQPRRALEFPALALRPGQPTHHRPLRSEPTWGSRHAVQIYTRSPLLESAAPGGEATQEPGAPTLDAPVVKWYLCQVLLFPPNNLGQILPLRRPALAHLCCQPYFLPDWIPVGLKARWAPWLGSTITLTHLLGPGAVSQTGVAPHPLPRVLAHRQGFST